MLPALGALSSILDALSPALSKSPSSQPAANNPFDLAGNTAASGTSTSGSCYGGCSQISPATMRALLAAQGQSTSAPTGRADALKDLFSQLDASGDGKVSKAEFESALGAGGTNLAAADDVFNKLDTNGDGSVSLDELSSALKGAGGKGHHHHHRHVAGSDGSGGAGDSSGTSVSSDPLLQALAASSATTTSSTSKIGDTGLSSLLTPVDSSQLTPISLSAASYARLEQLIHNGPQSSTSTTPLSLSA